MQTPVVTRLPARAPAASWAVYPAAIVFALFALAGFITLQLSAAMPSPLSDVVFLAGLWFAVGGTLSAAVWLIFGRTIFRD